MSCFRKVGIIVNPIAGEGTSFFPLLQSILKISSYSYKRRYSSMDILQQLESVLEKNGKEVTSFTTEAPGHAEKIAQTCVKESYDMVIVIGGDGTLSEVINGLAGSCVVLGIVPFGGANVLASSLSLPSSLDDLIACFCEPSIQSIDLGLCNGRYFSCMLGVGFDATVIKKVSGERKKKMGPFSYVLASLGVLWSGCSDSIFVEDLSRPQKTQGYYIVVGNTRFYGGRRVMTDRACHSDGLLDVCVLKNPGAFYLARYGLAIIREVLSHHSHVDYFQTDALKIDSTQREDVQLDGEVMTSFPLEIRCVPHSLHVIQGVPLSI